MADSRIIMLATMSQLRTNTALGESSVTASCRGLSSTVKVKTTESEAAQRALINLLAKVDAVQELTERLGPKPPPQKPRGIAAANAARAAAQERSDGSVEVTIEDEIPQVSVDPDQGGVFRTVSVPSTAKEDTVSPELASNPHLSL